MFGGKNAKIEKVDTIIGDGTAFVGTIKATGIVRIDGKMEGELQTQGDIVIGEKGEVAGTVKGRNITVAGRVIGNIEADDKLHLLSSGMIDGDIEIKTLVVDEGGHYLGGCVMKEPDGSKRKLKDQHGKKQREHEEQKESKEGKESKDNKDSKESKDNKEK